MSIPAFLAKRLENGPIKLGTRASPLAMAQAEETATALRNIWGLSEEQVVLIPQTATGDQILDKPLRDIGGKELWTRNLDQFLLNHKVDCCVHSMKDVETLRPDTIHLAAILPRADVRDCLIGADFLADIPQNGTLGTSSPRRAAQMRALRPDVETKLFRGNVATRLEKLKNGEADVTLLAAAGLDRLGMTKLGARLDAAQWLPAASQGAIGIECLSGDAEMIKLLSAINDLPSYTHIMLERKILALLDGNCHSPIGMYCQQNDAHLQIYCALFSSGGNEQANFKGQWHDFKGTQEEIKAMAMHIIRHLSEQATPQIIALFPGLLTNGKGK